MTAHFGLVSDFLSEAFTRLRSSSRVNILDGRVHLGGALSGRNIEAVRKTVSGLVKLLYPNAHTIVPDEDLEVDRQAGTREPAQGQRATEASLQERVPQHSFQLHARTGRSGGVCRNT
ncbi:MAG: hypothetical protein JO223_17420 [Hyphomicrobiales bacterium]|nr:hypothetical protein [Hyphomicrobiales bacterium]MBV8441218.1 hypothetical protein [Hyphomicrobiales bacterium]